MSTPTPLPIRVAQTLGITSSLLFAGLSLSLSTAVIPPLLESPTPLLLRQWKSSFIRGRATNPPFVILAALSYFYLAYSSHTSPSPSLPADKTMGYLIAGALAIGIMPYTVVFILPTNRRLWGMVEEAGVGKKRDGEGKREEIEERRVGKGEQSVHQLVDRWAVLNFGRVAMMFGSGVVGVWTMLN